MTMPGVRHNSSPAEGRGETSPAQTPPKFRALQRNPRGSSWVQPRSSWGLWELERDRGTCWERDPEGDVQEPQALFPAKQTASTTLAQLGTAPGTRSPWELGMSSSKVVFLLFLFFSFFSGRKQLLNRYFLAFFFFSSLAWPNPNLLKTLMEKDVSLWLILFPSLQEGKGRPSGGFPPLYFFFF